LNYADNKVHLHHAQSIGCHITSLAFGEVVNIF
jgi:hypothetical protein